MKTDLYTKTLLTVIAGCLLWLCVNGAIPTASAQAQQPPPAHVVLVDQNNVPITALPVAVMNQSLPVTMATSPVPVMITAIERVGTWTPVPVDVIRPAPTLQPTP
jgi:hypothetical protein